MGQYEYELLTSYSDFALWGCKKCGTVVWDRDVHSKNCVADLSRMGELIG